METFKPNIDFNVNQLIKVVKKVAPKDRLKLNDAIWNDDTTIPIDHQKIVLDRMAKANPKRLLDWDEVSKML